MNIPHGLINQSALNRKNDYLFRLSLKALVVNDDGEVLVVKETGRTWWDLPGGGMDHDENIKDAIARELSEEVSMLGDFEYQIIDIDDPSLLKHANVWQVRLVFEVTPKSPQFAEGVDGDEIAFMDPGMFKDSTNDAERRIYDYSQKIR